MSPPGARRHATRLRGRRGESNFEYVGRIWDAFRAGGVAEMADLVPDDVQWRPLEAEGRTLDGTGELQEFWASHVVSLPTPRMLHGRGDDVLLQAELRLSDGSVR